MPAQHMITFNEVQKGVLEKKSALDLKCTPNRRPFKLKVVSTTAIRVKKFSSTVVHYHIYGFSQDRLTFVSTINRGIIQYSETLYNKRGYYYSKLN